MIEFRAQVDVTEAEVAVETAMQRGRADQRVLKGSTIPETERHRGT